MLVLEGFGDSQGPVRLLLRDPGLAYPTARLSDHPPLAPTSSYTFKVQQFGRAFGLPAMNDVAACWRFDDQRFARTRESSI